MRIGMFVDKPLPNERPTGIGIAAFNMALGLSKRKIAIRFVCRGEIEETLSVNDYLSVSKLLHYSRDNGSMAKRLLEREGYDLTHVHSSAALPALLVGRASGRLTVTHVHGYEPLRPIRLTLIRRVGMRVSHRIVAVSQDTRAHLIEDNGQSPGKVAVAYNGVDTEAFRPLTDTSGMLARYGLEKYDRIVLSVGSVQRRKGQSTVIEALPRVLKEWPKLGYVNIGAPYDNSYLEKLLQRANALGVAKSIRFLKDVPQADLVALINSADFCVHPATREGFGLAVVEEMACGKAVVAFKKDSIPEIIKDGVDGVLVESGDWDGFADSVLETLNDSNLARNIGKAARLKVLTKFTWDATASSLNGIYSGLRSA